MLVAFRQELLLIFPTFLDEGTVAYEVIHSWDLDRQCLSTRVSSPAPVLPGSLSCPTRQPAMGTGTSLSLVESLGISAADSVAWIPGSDFPHTTSVPASPHLVCIAPLLSLLPLPPLLLPFSSLCTGAKVDLGIPL